MSFCHFKSRRRLILAVLFIKLLAQANSIHLFLHWRPAIALPL